MAMYDVENFLDDIKTILQNNLPAKLTAIAAEKADSLTLTAPDNAGYFWSDLPDNANVPNPWIVYGLAGPISVESIGQVGKRELQAFVTLGHSAMMNETFDNIQRIFARYVRGISETVLENYLFIKGRAILKIDEEAYPIEIVEEAGETVRIAGITITATIV